MTFYDSVISDLKGVIGSKKEGVLLSNLDNEYKSLMGDSIPLKKLGYNSIHDFLDNHGELFNLQGTGKYCRVLNVVSDIENDSTLNLINMIQNTHIKYKKKPLSLRTGYKGSNYIPNYNQNYKSGYQSSYASNYQPSYNSSFQPSYNSSFQPSYNSSFQPSYNYNYQNSFNPSQPSQYIASYQTNYKPQQTYENFRVNASEPRVGFNTGSNFKFNFTSSYKPDVKKLVTEPPVNSNKNPGIYHHPNSGYSTKAIVAEEKRTNLLVPLKCLKNVHKSSEKSNVVVISDDEEFDLAIRPNVSTQTLKNILKPNKRQFVSMQSLELVNMLIDVIIEFKSVTFDDVIKVKVNGDLCFHFRHLSGINIDPVIFYDYVQYSLELPMIQFLYKGLIYLDPSKSICLLNMKSICNTKMKLPEFEFNYQKEYIVEIVETFHDNLIAFKIPTNLNLNLEWKKNSLPEQTKEIIESQHFWSWIPGTLCLVRLPYSIVKKHNVTPIERAVILFAEVASLEDESLQNSQRYLIHKASFFLIDHKKELENLYSCASSFQEVKQKAKENNNTEITFVCNMSISAKNTPSKIQYATLENFEEMSPSFLDSNSRLKPNSKIILTSVKKISIVFHFQPMYNCSSRLYNIADVQRPLNHYRDIEVVQNNGKKVDSIEDDSNETIVISDSEDEEPVARIPIINGHSDLFKHKDSHQSNNVVPLQPQKIIIPLDDISVNPQHRKIIAPLRDKVVVAPRHEKIKFKISSTKLPDNVHGNGLNGVFESQSNTERSNNTHTVSHGANKRIHGVDIVEQKSECDNNKKALSAVLCETNYDSINFIKNEIPISNSIISYLENNSNTPWKCLIPLTIDNIHAFSGRIVKLLHIQMGSAVLMIFDSVKIMKRDIKMSLLKKQILQKATEIAVGRFYLWNGGKEDSYGSECLLVQVLKNVSATSVLINIVHRGLMTIINIDTMLCVPDHKHCDMHTMIGPSIGSFTLHMMPDWCTPDDSIPVSNQLFTAFFTSDNKLVLEYFEQPCRFFNIEMISVIERSLTVNHCNLKSRNFIEMLSKSLLESRNFVGNLLQMIEYNGENFDDLPITKVLRKVSQSDKAGVWFGSVLVGTVGGGGGVDSYEKLSPHNFMEEEFCVDRLMYDDRRHSLRLLEHQGVYIDMPDYLEGLYKFDPDLVQGSLKSNDEFLSRYMLAEASLMPDLKYLCNKLIFDIRPF